IMSYRDFMNLIKHKGANRINQQYDVVSTLGLWSAERFIQRNVHVHSSVVGSYSYVAKNQHYFREWSNEMRPNYKYMKQVIQKIDRVGAVNPKLAATIKKYCPNKQVHYIKPFVNTNKFKPLRSANKKDKSTFTIGWVGNSDKRSKIIIPFTNRLKIILKTILRSDLKKLQKTHESAERICPNFIMPLIYY